MKNQSEVKTPVLRLKFTNLKTQIYPDPLTETDYHKFKVGDLVCLGYNYNTIFQIDHIFRDMMDPRDLHHWETRVVQQQMNYQTKSSHPVIRDQKLFDLLEEYKKNGNFGVCRIRVKTLARGTNLVKRQTQKLFWEPDTVKCINYNGLTKVDLDQLKKVKDYNAASLDNKIQALVNRKNNILKHKAVLDQIDNLLNPKLPEPVPTGIDEVEEKEDHGGVPVEQVMTPVILVPSQEDLKELESCIEWVQ